MHLRLAFHTQMHSCDTPAPHITPGVSPVTPHFLISHSLCDSDSTLNQNSHNLKSSAQHAVGPSHPVLSCLYVHFAQAYARKHARAYKSMSLGES